MYFFCELGVSKWINSLGLCGCAAKFRVLGQAPISDEVQWLLKLNPGVLILVRSCQGMYQRVEVYVLIVEFVLATHCILTQGQVIPELPDSPQLLHRNTTFSIGVPIYPKLTIARFPIE